MRRNSKTAEQLVEGGVKDPRTLPGAIQFRLEDVSHEEATALESIGMVADQFQTLRLPIQGMQLFEAGPSLDGLHVSAVFPKVLKQQHSLVVLTPEQEAKAFQEAIGMVEIRIVFKKEALQPKEVKNE